MKSVGYVFGGLLVLLGLMFCVSAASTGIGMRWVMGGILGGSGFVLIYFMRMQVPDTKITVTRKIDLSGDVKLEQMRCNNCGATLDSKCLTVEAGAIFVSCPYCNSEYQIEEAPIW